MISFATTPFVFILKGEVINEATLWAIKESKTLRISIRMSLQLILRRKIRILEI